jgi:hypothetical protein
MQQLCRITIPGLLVSRDFEEVRRRLLCDFPNIQEVVATTAPGTLIVLCRGGEDVDAWIDAVYDLVDGGPQRLRRLPACRGPGGTGDDTAA